MIIVNAKKVGMPQEPTLYIPIASNYQFYFCLNSASGRGKFVCTITFQLFENLLAGKLKEIEVLII